MRAIKERFDPKNILNPGQFAFSRCRRRLQSPTAVLTTNRRLESPPTER